MHATTVAIDLAKDVFERAFAHAGHRVLERKRLTGKAFARAREARAIAHRSGACGWAQCCARRFVRMGHRVDLLPAHQVRPCVLKWRTERVRRKYEKGVRAEWH